MRRAIILQSAAHTHNFTRRGLPVLAVYLGACHVMGQRSVFSLWAYCMSTCTSFNACL